MTPGSQGGPIVLFDGDCGLCVAAVQFVLRRDAGGRFRFAALRSQVAASLLRQHGQATVPVNTMVLLAEGRVHVRSGAALRIARLLGWPWSLLWGLWLVPWPLRDLVYRLVAHSRRRLSRGATCLLPKAELNGRFLDVDEPPTPRGV